jgi:hypothetical protein
VTILFSQKKPTTSNQPPVLFLSQQINTSRQPNERADVIKFGVGKTIYNLKGAHYYKSSSGHFA